MCKLHIDIEQKTLMLAPNEITVATVALLIRF